MAFAGAAGMQGAAMARTTSDPDKSLQVAVKPFGPTTEELLAIGARVAA